jgi:hypothetical protein
MDKLTESYLKKIIIESLSREVEELAYVRKDKQSTSLKSGEKRLRQYVPMNDDGSPFPEEDRKKSIPDYVIANPNLIDGGEIIVVPLGCNELEMFKDQNKEWLESLGVKHGNLEVQLIQCGRTKYPHKSLEKFYPKEKTGEKMGEQEKIKRKFFRIVYNELDNSEFQGILNKASIPALNMKDNSEFGKAQTKKTNISQYDMYGNDKIEFNLHSYNGYDSLKNFLDSVIGRIKGTENIPNTFFMSRQYNTGGYGNYDAARKMEKKYKGKTPVQKKDSRDYYEQNLDATVRLEINITGELMDNSYLWNFGLKTLIGRKLEDESGLKGGYLDNNLIQSSETVQLEPNIEFNEENTVMDNKDIVNGLINVLDDVKSQIEQISPKTMLKWATVRRNEVVRNELA